MSNLTFKDLQSFVNEQARVLLPNVKIKVVDCMDLNAHIGQVHGFSKDGTTHTLMFGNRLLTMLTDLETHSVLAHELAHLLDDEDYSSESEFKADLNSISFGGDYHALIAGLTKIEASQRYFTKIDSTHPSIEQRAKHLGVKI